jgi:uncharacterized hydrophobic protein (TIGR00271 family)
MMKEGMNSLKIEQETVERIAEQAEVTPTYLVLMATSGMLAAVAFLENSVPLLIGSMAVAPALAPLALVAFAIVGGKPGYVGKGLWAGFAGLLLAAIFATATAWLLNITNIFPAESNMLNKPLLEERVNPGWSSVVAALAAGVAGTVALAKNKSDTLVGVVAALALVPAAAAVGIALLSQDPDRSLGALKLLAINTGFIIVTGVVTLLVVRPDIKNS